MLVFFLLRFLLLGEDELDIGKSMDITCLYPAYPPPIQYKSKHTKTVTVKAAVQSSWKTISVVRKIFYDDVDDDINVVCGVLETFMLFASLSWF
jgi:hypothetical protein